jgi:hypothetical protein
MESHSERGTMTEFELFTELPEGTTHRRSKYADFWSFVEENPGSWVKWPYDGKTSNVSSLARNHGFVSAVRAGQSYVRKES